MTNGRAPRTIRWLGALLVIYLAYPVGAFLYRALSSHDEGWHDPGLWSALRVSAEGATISLLLGIVTGVPLAYFLAHHKGWFSSALGVIVQLPLAVPPLISGILLVYIVGPYTFLGRLSGERLTQTMYAVIIAQTFVSAPFLVITARSAFRAVDPSLSDVAATLGHGPLARFLRVEVPTASDGLRSGMILMWLRAFGEYGAVVVLAYHPYSLPVYVENLFSSSPLSEAIAPTLLALGVAVIATAAGRLRSPRPGRASPAVNPRAPTATRATALGFDIELTVDAFRLRAEHTADSHRLAIIGPSGSGKSMMLRALAGLMGPDVGTVTYGGDDVSALLPEERQLGYVPQGYGLLPGRTVWEQATFGVHADASQASWWLQKLQIDDLYARVPEQLSGGQRQRVSLARALAVSPRMLLLDEPFSALDAPVRSELRRELRRIQHEAGLSTVIVTHDPEEAAMLADTVLVLKDGRVLQAGRCRDVYQRPASTDVGRLVGMENLFEVTDNDRSSERRPSSWLLGEPVEEHAQQLSRAVTSLWHVPPEALHLSDTPPRSAPDGTTLSLGTARVADIIDLGRTIELVLQLNNGRELRMRTTNMPGVSLDQSCGVEVDPDAVSVWPAGELTRSYTPPPTRL